MLCCSRRFFPFKRIEILQKFEKKIDKIKKITGFPKNCDSNIKFVAEEDLI